MALIDQPRATNSAASQSSSSGWLGFWPIAPKSSADFTRPSPKWCFQSRLTITRGRRGLTADRPSVRASSRRPLPAAGDGLRPRLPAPRGTAEGRLARVAVIAADQDRSSSRSRRRSPARATARGCSPRPPGIRPGPPEPTARALAVGRGGSETAASRSIGAASAEPGAGAAGSSDMRISSTAMKPWPSAMWVWAAVVVGRRPVGDLEVGAMAEPHADVPGDPARLDRRVDRERQRRRRSGRGSSRSRRRPC